MAEVVRLAALRDVERIEDIESLADAMLAGLLDLDEPFEAEEALVRLSMPGFVLVAERDDVVIGFAHVVTDGDDAHLEQLAVDPAHVRSGIGRCLVAAVAEQARGRGARSLTVRAFADVGASGEFHRAVGFVDATPQSAFHHEIVTAEIGLGLDDLSPRIWLALPL